MTAYKEHILVLIASNNQHKIQEIQEIIPTIPLISPQAIQISCRPDETGDSFAQNALIKAKQFYKIVQQHTNNTDHPISAVLAEDSGLCVEALGGRPGIYSARYAFSNDPHTQPQADLLYQCKALLQEMQHATNRYAYFVCNAVLYYGPHQFVSSQAIWEGEIVLDSPSGSKGFGYDPIFFLPEFQCTSASLAEKQKNSLSHRAKALRALAPAMERLLQQ